MMIIQTNWCVITGAPSSGKTTLIEALASEGFATAPEVARNYIAELLKHNYTIAQVHSDNRRLQRGILALALKRERTLNHKQLIFFDRGTADSIGYFNYYRLKASEVSHVCQHRRYKKIFFCHQLPVVNDEVRVENNEAAQQIGRFIYEAYCGLGYTPIELPAVSVKERLLMIKENLPDITYL